MKNIKVVINSLLAIVSIVLAIVVHWLFIVPAVILMLWNQKLLLSKKAKKKS